MPKCVEPNTKYLFGSGSGNRPISKSLLLGIHMILKSFSKKYPFLTRDIFFLNPYY